ncbi:MAG: pilus assembly protein [Novosphingobium sp.]
MRASLVASLVERGRSLRLDRLLDLGGRLRLDRGGNVMVMLAFGLIPLTFAIGFGIDYSRAQKMQTDLNSIADAAVLAAVDPAMLCQSSATAKAAATGMFNAQVSGLTDLAGVTPTVTVNPASSAAGCAGSLRTATVAYTASVRNVFSSILGSPTLTVSGSASSDASQPPSINFYVAMDVSPSMLLPTTTTGIANLKNGVIWSGAGAFGWPVVGCTFACHSQNSHTWNYGNFVRDTNGNALYTTGFDTGTMYRVSCSNANVYDVNFNQIGTGASITNSGATACGGNFWNNGPTVNNTVNLRYKPNGSGIYTNVTVNFPDSWWLAQNYATINPGQQNITLRLDAESPAAQNLATYAHNIELLYATAPTPPVYKLQFFTFAYGAPTAVSTSPWGTMTDVATSYTSTFPSLTANAPLMAGIGCWTSSCPGSNAFTDVTALLNGMSSTMPSSAGLGTPASPQNVLIILTDGAQDNSTGDGMGAINATNITQCNAIKANGTKIAILYTTYDPNTINYTAFSTFNNFASGPVPTIQAQLQSCATRNADGSYLMQTVSTDGDISAALNQLFQNVVQSSRLVQ